MWDRCLRLFLNGGVPVFFLPLLMLLTIIAAIRFFWTGIPPVLAWICLVFGCMAILSRVLAWLTGAAQGAIQMLSEEVGPGAVRRNLAMEVTIWILALANVYFFFVRAL